ncbi:MAG TPA: BlaI/MecI/CopY family transcriptional regulator [Acidobacteriota bacterium]|jgi:predicted transcriptional regulator
MKLTPVEFEIMEIIWERGSALVKDVHSQLARRKGLAYTTVMTEMDHMYKKGLLAHAKKGRAYLYTPRVTRAQALSDTLENFVDDFFHGSREELMRFISGRAASSEAVSGLKKTEREISSPPTVSAVRTAESSLAAGEGRAAVADEEEDVTLL